jgi:CHAD domain-containing protein
MSKEALIAASGGSIHEHRKATRKMRWWYEALADYMIANPKAKQNDMALYFDRGVATISTILNSDSFKAYMRQRRDEHAKTLDSDVRNKLLTLTGDVLDIMIDKVDKKRDTLPIADLQRTADMTLKALGFTAPQGPSVVVNNPTQHTTVVVPVSLEDLQQAQAALRNSQNRMIDITPNELPVREARQSPLEEVRVHDPLESTE